VLGAAALLDFVVGRIWPSETWIVLLAADILLLWASRLCATACVRGRGLMPSEHRAAG
jgi:hypothetical protein